MGPAMHIYMMCLVFINFLKWNMEQFGSLLVLSDKSISYTNAIGVPKTKLCIIEWIFGRSFIKRENQ